ncbi:MAG: peptidoglycan-binding protein LysM [Lewinellaceae bacterium]|nr:peptidoglycan-binding protein LysM [Lewinellaceae bacterium]
MGLFSFLKNAGANLFKGAKPAAPSTPSTSSTPDLAAQIALKNQKIQLLRQLVESFGFDVKDLILELNDDTVIVNGKVASQEQREKVVLVLGNVDGIATVDDRLEVIEPAPEAVFYEVKKGDTLSKIAKAHYGNAMKYPVIFEANKPMLKDPDLIYPGQVLRIPPLD